MRSYRWYLSGATWASRRCSQETGRPIRSRSPPSRARPLPAAPPVRRRHRASDDSRGGAGDDHHPLDRGLDQQRQRAGAFLRNAGAHERFPQQADPLLERRAAKLDEFGNVGRCVQHHRRHGAAQRIVAVFQHLGSGFDDTADRDRGAFFRAERLGKSLGDLSHAGARHFDHQLILAAGKMKIQRTARRAARRQYVVERGAVIAALP